MIHGKLTCPSCGQHLELTATKAPSQQSETATTTRQAGDIGELLDAIDESSLTGKSAEFVADMKAKYEQYGARTYCNEKQRAWLKSLAGIE